MVPNMKSLLLAVCLCILGGCTSTKSSSTPRTATEQLLISNAVDQSLSRVDFSTFSGRKIFVEEKYIDAVDAKYVLASIRHRLILHGARLSEKKDDSDVTIELRSGGIGTDFQDMYVGIPEVTFPGMVSIPEIRLITRDSQSAAAKIGLVAYETSTGEILGHGGTSLAESDRHNWFILGVGPYQNGTLKDEKTRARETAERQEQLPVPNHIAFGNTNTPHVQSDASRVRLAGDEKPDFWKQ
jgi:hypothetical protein